MSLLSRIQNKLQRELKPLKLRLNRLGDKRECYVCKTKFNEFEVLNTGHCYYCRSTGRERHLLMFFDKLGLWNKIKGANILHFAPETHFSQRIVDSNPAKYVKADLTPATYWYIKDVIKMDATKVEFPDNTFDFFIANHILEHVPDYKKVLSETFRVLKPGGIAILQTPFESALINNIEDEGITSPELRIQYYGQWDHVRMFSEARLLESIRDAGFKLEIVKHEDFFSSAEGEYYGTSPSEYLLKAVKVG